MSGFRLATVELLRERQLKICAQQLHQAGHELSVAQEQRRQLAEQLRRPDSGPGLHPTAAELELASFYRERLRGDLQYLDVEIDRLARILSDHRSAWLHASAQHRAITALHERHRAARRLRQAHQDQLALDEAASTAAQRSTAQRRGASA